MNLLSSKDLAKQRIEICEACKHFRKRTRTCGTPIKGNKIGDKRLCGCFMDIKTTLRFSKCPLNKWGDMQVTEEDYKEIKKLTEALKVTTLDQEKIKYFSRKYLGLKTQASSCAPCVKSQIEKLKQIVTEYEK